MNPLIYPCRIHWHFVAQWLIWQLLETVPFAILIVGIGRASFTDVWQVAMTLSAVALLLQVPSIERRVKKVQR